MILTLQVFFSWRDIVNFVLAFRERIFLMTNNPGILMATVQWLLETEFAACSNCGNHIKRSIEYW